MAAAQDPHVNTHDSVFLKKFSLVIGFLVLGGRLLENPQHYYPDPPVGVGLRSGLENRQRALSFTYQFWSIIHLIYLSQ